MTEARGGGRAAVVAVTILTLMNLLNYVDRFVAAPVKDLFKKEWHLTDAQTSWQMTGFIIVYMLTSPLFGALADRLPRKYIIAAGVAFWSLATAGAALAGQFWQFLLARSLVGVGEAAYATLSPSLISDYYPPERRNRVLTIFYVAIPFGVAIGFVSAGALGAAYGWRAAFLICGLPGILLSLLVLFIKEPPRGQFDPPGSTVTVSWKVALAALRRNKHYVNAVAGYVAVTFAQGALAEWVPYFLEKHRDWSKVQASSVVGITAVVGGLAGTAAGGLLAGFFKKRTRLPFFFVCGGSMVLCTVFALPALISGNHTVVWVSMFLAQFFMWFYGGPLNAVLVNCTDASLRARAFALSILLIHLLGDAASPTIVGMVSDGAGLPLAMSIIPVMFAVGGLIWLWGWRRLPASDAF